MNAGQWQGDADHVKRLQPLGHSRLRCGQANGAGIRIANIRRQNVNAIGGIAVDKPRPTIQLHAQQNGARVGSR